MRKVKQQIAIHLFWILHEANLSDVNDDSEYVNDLSGENCFQDNLFGDIASAIKSLGYTEQYNQYIITSDRPTDEQLLDIIMRVNTRFVITNTRNLINPVGYDSSDPVYHQTDIAIHCDIIPDIADLPTGCDNLYIHDVKYLTDKHNQ